MIHIIRTHATRQQIDEMLESLGTYIKLAVDIERGILAGGGALHADCDLSRSSTSVRGSTIPRLRFLIPRFESVWPRLHNDY